jgi:hypothetical protein
MAIFSFNFIIQYMMIQFTNFTNFYTTNFNKISLRYVGKSPKAHLVVTPMLDEIIIGSMLGDLSAERLLEFIFLVNLWIS